MKKLLLILIFCLTATNLAYGAIARDPNAATSATAGSTVNKTLTFAYTVTAGSTNRLIVAIGFEWNGTQSITSVTYAGTTMTLGKAQPTNANGDTSYVYFLDNPTSGANNVVVNGVTNEQMHGTLNAFAQNYSGVKQNGVVDASYGTSGASGTTYTGTLTVVADNSWATMVNQNGGAIISASTNATAVSAEIGSPTARPFDNRDYGAIAAGSFSLNATASSSVPWSLAMISFEPDTTAAAAEINNSQIQIIE